MASFSEKQRTLLTQVDSIIETSDEEFPEVIIKAGRATPAENKLSRLVVESMRKRSMSTSPRDVLPVKRDELLHPQRTMTAAGAGHDLLSLAAQASAALMGATAESLKKSVLDSMQPVLKSDVVQQSLAHLGLKTDGSDRPKTFWSSGSFLTRMDRTALLKLCEGELVNSLEGIFPNRRVVLPPAVTPKQIPRSVKDNKVSAWGTRTIGALAVWGAFGARGQGVTIGLLDTGVDPEHPDLKGKVASWAEFDAKGDRVSGSTPYDSDRHGTHCAGTIVGGNASGRWIGVAPEAELAAALVINGTRGGTDAQILAGIQWAIDQRVDVINMSLGGLVWGPEVPPTYTQAIHSAVMLGIPVVTAVGNEGSQTSGSPGNDCFAFTVGATDPINRVAGFSGGRTQVIHKSNYLTREMLPLIYSKPDLSAPGVAVYSCVPGGGWEYFNGTSMAAPHVSGAIALLLSSTDILDIPETERAFVIQDLLTGSAEELGEAGQDHRFGFGRIDVLRAIGFAKDLGY